MSDKYFEHIIYGGDYNPEQWIDTPEIWDEDMRLMNLAHINSASVGIFSWSMLEPEEGVYNFGWLDTILDKLYENGKSVILATPSGARPAWLAQKYPEVLRVNENGIREEFGVRHNHCLTSPVYRQKVREINTALVTRYKDHPAVKMWHISNEYCGECHCELCQNAFREWLKKEYNNDIDHLNFKWWNTFWSHRFNDFSQISSPKGRGESLSVPLKLSWKRFVSDSHISFFENEIAPLKQLAPDIPVTANLMRMYDGLDYQEFAKHLDIVSWDNYPDWDCREGEYVGPETGFVHDAFRAMKGGKPFFMMESTPSVVNWHRVNKIAPPGTLALTSIQAIAHGSDSVQYFQWRKSRGSHEKFHGAVVDHCGHENTRVFGEVTQVGQQLEKLDAIVGTRISAKVAVICDWQNKWVTERFCGYNHTMRDYVGECLKWYIPLWKRGISTDVIAMDADYSGYDVVLAPFLYMLKDGTAQRIRDYVQNGGHFLATFLTGNVDRDDLCFLGGFPGDGLREVFGVWCEETDSLSQTQKGKASFNGKSYATEHFCDLLHAAGAQVLGTYESDFYAGMPCVTVNNYGKGKAYYAAFSNSGELMEDVCDLVLTQANIRPDTAITVSTGVSVKKRGDTVFVMNFAEHESTVTLDREYTNVLTGEKVSGQVTLALRGFLVLE